MPVGLCSAEFGAQRTEGLGLHDLCDIGSIEPFARQGVRDKSCPAGSLGVGGDGFVLGRELRDRPPPVRLVVAGLVCGGFGAGPVQDACQDGAGRGEFWQVGVDVCADGVFVVRPRVRATYRFSRLMLGLATVYAVSTVRPWARCAVIAYPRSTCSAT